VVTAYRSFGKDWERIAGLLEGRSAIAVHNHFNCSIKKLRGGPACGEKDAKRRMLLLAALGPEPLLSYMHTYINT
jgi:hypothetical protein